MKKVFLILLSTLPFFLSAQNDCNFFKHKIIQVEKTNLNSSASDMGPSYVNDELWYSSYTEEEITKLAEGKSKNIFYNLFSTAINADGTAQENKNIELESISEGYHAGPVSYCPSTKELFVTLSNYDNPEIKNNVYRVADIRLKIIVLKEVNNAWTVTEELPFNDAAYSVGQPVISKGGEVLYFVSDMPGGIGGTDLYRAIRNDGKWGEPINLGEQINTTGNEMFPFMYKGNTLIFASNGRQTGATDLDLYYSCLSDNNFSTPIELDQLNTDFDDFGLVINSNGKIGYLSSNKEGGLGDDDIYKVLFEQGIYKLELLVRDKISLEPIPSVTVAFNDGKKIVTDVNGLIKRDLDYDMDYLATSELEGYVNGSVAFSTIDADYGTLKQVIEVEKAEVEKVYTLNNIFYDFDKWDILPESEVELNNLVKNMKDNPSWKVELSSHTDSRGSDSYNQRLSQKRSDSAVNYIVSKGIDRSRIIAKGYGETQLVNKCDDGVECTEEEHRLNRRTEFKILEMDKN